MPEPHAPPKPIGLGIVGTGAIVRMVSETLQAEQGLRVVAVAGTSEAAALRIAGAFAGATACRSFLDLLQRDLDAVFIATPPHLHCAMTVAALEAGKHVICEKPLVMTLDELRRVQEVQRLRPELRVASCSSRFHCCPPVRRARDLVAAGRLGKILTVRLNTSSEYPGPANSWPAWKRQRTTSGGGLLMDWGVYDLDWLQFLLGDLFQPESVTGSIGHWPDQGMDLETSYLAHIRCRDGLTISLERRPEHGPRFQRAEIRGEAGGLDLPFMPGAKPEQLRFYRRRNDDTLELTELPETMNNWDAILAYPIVDLTRVLRHGGEIASPLEHQRKIYVLIAAIYKSATSGESVRLTGPLHPSSRDNRAVAT